MGIVHVTPSHIAMQFGDRMVTVECESYARGHGSPDFVIYADSIRKWDSPHNQINIDSETKAQILELLKTEMKQRNWSFEIE